MIITIIIFLIVLSLLVFVHELGHFIVAKRSGMKVHEFGFGFPPRLFGIQKVNGKWKMVWGHKDTKTDDTVYSVNWIPLGGFVKIMGEDGVETEMGDGGWSKTKDNHTAADTQSFANKSFWPRFLTLVAGVVMNFILAGALFSVGYMVGLPSGFEDINDVPKNATFSDRRVAIIEVAENSPAEKTGLMAGDIIQSVDGQQFDTIENLQAYIKSHKGDKINFDVKRINEDKQFTVETLTEAPPGGGTVGIGMALYGKLKYSFIYAIGHGFETAYNQLINIAQGLWGLISGGIGLQNLGGPIKIAQYTGQAADLGIISLVQFTAFLSLNLALLNALPIPALDGGRILFLIIETVRRKRNNPKIEQYANGIGFMVLLLLMLVISIHDFTQTEFFKNLF